MNITKPGARNILILGNRGKKKYYDQFDKDAVNSRKPLTDDEINLIMAHSIPDRELSAKIGRTVMAIQIVRSKVRNGRR